MTEQAQALKEKTEQHANPSAAPSGEEAKTQSPATERPGKPSIEPRSALGASTTSARKTAREADDSLQEKIIKAHAGDIPVFTEPTPQSPAPFTQAKGEASGLAPVSTVRAMPELTKKEKNGKAAQAKSNAKAGSKADSKACKARREARCEGTGRCRAPTRTEEEGPAGFAQGSRPKADVRELQGGRQRPNARRPQDRTKAARSPA